MANTKFIVKVDRGGTRAPEYVQRIDRTPIRTTTDRKLALVMGKFTAEDAIKSIQTSQRIPELVSVQVKYGQLSFETKLGVRSRAHTLPVQPSRTPITGGFHGILSPRPSTGSTDSL
jgi:hypothetical protein